MEKRVLGIFHILDRKRINSSLASPSWGGALILILSSFDSHPTMAFFEDLGMTLTGNNNPSFVSLIKSPPLLYMHARSKLLTCCNRYIKNIVMGWLVLRRGEANSICGIARLS